LFDLSIYKLNIFNPSPRSTMMVWFQRQNVFHMHSVPKLTIAGEEEKPTMQDYFGSS